jgi:hypothetical protein
VTLFSPRCDGGDFTNTGFNVLIWRGRLLSPRGGRGAENPADAPTDNSQFCGAWARHPPSLNGRIAEYPLSPMGDLYLLARARPVLGACSETPRKCKPLGGALGSSKP